MRAIAGFFFISAVLILMASSPQPVHSSPEAWLHRAQANPALRPVPGQGTPVNATYDEQLGITFARDFSQIAYNVTAVAQSDSNGFGPGYILNGLTEVGYWYQMGLSYDWPYQTGGYDQGFHALYEVFNSSGVSVFPAGGGGGLLNFTGAVNGGDSVLLKLSFSAGKVDLLASDWKTGAMASETYPAEGSKFVGLRASSGANGFFTGLMTEWYHASPYYGSEAQVTYTDSTAALSSAVLWADEFKANDSVPLFSDSHSYTFLIPTTLLYFSTHGATESADAYAFITGSQGPANITLSYSVYGGGTGYSPPLLNYTFNGVQHTIPLSTTPTTYTVDAGSSWQVSSYLPGGSSTERWETDEQTVGVSNEQTGFIYWHQFLAYFGYSVHGGSHGSSAPQIETTEYGSSVEVNGNTTAWTDAGSTFSYPPLLPGSTLSDRWASLDYTGTVAGPMNLVVPYFRQFVFTLDLILTGGGSPTPPVLSGIRFGSAFSTAVANGTTYFVDEGSGWSVSDLLPGSGPTERWFATQNTNGTAFGPLTLAIVYYHQYSISVGGTPLGGSVTVSAGWVDAGGSAQISEKASFGWQFEGWTGSGSGSYSGPVTTAPLVVVSGPISENATFYPGLAISAGPNGAVDYTSAAANGTVPAGGSTIIYSALGSTVTLRAVAASFLYAFAGWSPSAGGNTLSVTLSSPETVAADFELNPLPIVAVTSILLLAAVGASFFIRHRRHLVADSSSL